MSAGSTAAVRLEHVTIRRGGRVVVDDVTADVAAGCVTGVVGPSGSGKTTLMRAVVGVQRRVHGNLKVLGITAGDRALRRDVGYLTQTPSVYGDITVAANKGDNIDGLSEAWAIMASKLNEGMAAAQAGEVV